MSEGIQLTRALNYVKKKKTVRICGLILAMFLISNWEVLLNEVQYKSIAALQGQRNTIPVAYMQPDISL